ncbi:hypothetical protein F5X99DRAFT_428603 [Biscogniauxia marginata]|nr:hypothetical protein F5X99DRAFT_428603 [Biscogniauxia marginata]
MIESVWLSSAVSDYDEVGTYLDRVIIMDFPCDFYPSGKNPLPLLKRWVGEEDQQCFHLEPFEPTIEGGAGKELPREENIRPPWGFGEFSKVFVYPTSKEPGAYKHLRVFSTNLVGKNRRLNIYRNDETEFELAKYNPLRHPKPKDWNNPNLQGKHNVPVEGLEKAVLDLVNYPRISKCVMDGPLNFAPKNVELPMADQPPALSAVFSTPELFQLLIGHLWDRWEDLGNLFRTSQFSASCIQNNICHVEFATSTFRGLEHKSKKEKEKLRYSPLLLVSPGRSFYYPTAESLDDNARDSHGFPTHTGGKYGDISFERSVGNWFRCLGAIHEHTRGFTHVMFRGCEWLDMKALRAIVFAIPKLEAISVHQCFLLHFGHTEEFINLLNEVNETREPDMPKLRGDFTPMYYRGAKDPRYRTGEYGVIPNDEGHIDTRRAVVARLCRISRMCDDSGIDFLTPGKAFRAYLDRLPFKFGTLPTILMAIATLWDIENGRHHKAVADINYPTMLKEVVELERAVISSRVLREMYATTWRDLIIAVNGASMDLCDLDKLMFLRGELTLERCAFCGICLPAYFFKEEMIARQPGQVMCHGCQMVAYLNQQSNNFYQARRLIANQIFTIHHGRTDLTLKQLVKIEQKIRKVNQFARALEKRGEGEHKKEDKAFKIKYIEKKHKYGDKLTKRRYAMREARRLDKEFPALLELEIRDYEENIRGLRADLRNGIPDNSTTPRISDQIRCLKYMASKALAQAGHGQLVVPEKVDRTAASWEDELDWYRGCWAQESGQFKNRGPYGMFNADSNMADMWGGGPSNYEDSVDDASGESTLLAPFTADREWAATVSALEAAASRKTSPLDDDFW